VRVKHEVNRLSLIYESVAATRIDIHPVGEEPN
jgi:hypothetical protein